MTAVVPVVAAVPFAVAVSVEAPAAVSDSTLGLKCQLASLVAAAVAVEVVAVEAVGVEVVAGTVDTAKGIAAAPASEKAHNCRDCGHRGYSELIPD